MSTDVSFTATGPGQTGFSTAGDCPVGIEAGFDVGAVLLGDNTGVSATGCTKDGVLGITNSETNMFAGVKGIANGNSAGVWGESSSRVGVFGKGPTGVQGSSTTGDGVYGEIVTSSGAGVHGFGPSSETGTLGVFGEGDIGVKGSGNRGGVFESTSSGAQLRLIPAPLGTTLPVNGLPGDLFARMEAEGGPHQHPSEFVRVYLCVGPSAIPPHPILWSLVQLGSTSQGGT